MLTRRTMTAAAAGALLAMAAAAPAAAGWNDCGCGYGGYYGYGGYASYGYAGYGYAQPQVYYAPPTVSYAPPTYTIQPHYIVQPNVVVERTQVIPQTQYIRESASYWDEGSGYAGPAYASVGVAPRGPYLGTFSHPRYYAGHRRTRHWVGYRAYRRTYGNYRGYHPRAHRPYNRWQRW